MFGVEPASTTWSLELSPVVAASLPFLLEEVRAELARGGDAASSRTSSRLA